MFDYEYTESKIFNLLSDYLLTPIFIPNERLKEAGFNLKKIIKYNGFKEEIYLSSFKPNKEFKKQLGIDLNKKVVVIRPPAMVSNYHNNLSEKIIVELIKHFLKNSEILIIIVPRTSVDEEYIQKIFAFNERVIFLKKVVDGLQLVYASDVFISGGGTMNREAALLGIPTYSIFTGKRPYLDEYLSQMGRLCFIRDVDDIKKIILDKLEKREMLINSKNLANEISQLILSLAT